MCIVTPHVLRSLTLSTLLMISLPKSSNTKIFHIGFPSSSRIGTDDEVISWELALGSAWLAAGSWAWFKLRIFSMEPVLCHS